MFGFFSVNSDKVSGTRRALRAAVLAVKVKAPPSAPAAPEPAAVEPVPSESAATEPVTPAKPAAPKGPAAASSSSTIRVAVEKVDQIINLVGELVITQAMLVQRSSTLDPVLHDRLLNGIEQLERNARDLQEAVLSIRMLPMDYVHTEKRRV